MAVPTPATEYCFDREISRVLGILHNRFGGTLRSGKAEENIARLRIFNDESIPKFLERLERLRLEYDLSHPEQPLSDDRLKNILQYALVGRTWAQSIISTNRLLANFDIITNELITQESLVGRRTNVNGSGSTNSVNNLQSDSQRKKFRGCFRCGKEDCKDVISCSAPVPINFKSRCHTCGWNTGKDDSHVCQRQSYICGRCKGNHSSYICTNSVNSSVNAISSDIEIFALDFQLNAVQNGSTLKTTTVTIGMIGGSEIQSKALLDTGAGISCISLGMYQQLSNGNIYTLNKMRIRYANKSVGLAYGPTTLRVSLPRQEQAHPVNVLIVPELGYDIILNSDILRLTRAVWVFQDGRDILVTNPGNDYQKLFDLLDPPPKLQEPVFEEVGDKFEQEISLNNFQTVNVPDMVSIVPEDNSDPLETKDGRCIFALPWRSDSRPQLNLCEAQVRDTKLKETLVRNGHWDRFKLEIDDFVSRGFCHEILDVRDIRYFIPCLAIPKRDSERLRIVFDARHLNTFLQVEEVMCRSTLPSLLLFRHFKFVQGTDLSTAFLQIHLPKGDSSYCGFIVDGRFFKMTRLLFGLKPSPSGMTQAAATVIHRARAQIPTPATTFGISVYIDDVLVGADVRETCSNTFNRVLSEFAALGFPENPVKRFSNVIPADPPKERERVLGLWWDTAEDTLSCGKIRTSIKNITPSSLQRVVPQFYDPLGLHIGLQLLGRHLCREVDFSLLPDFLKLVELQSRVPRRATFTPTLIVCCDASKVAHASLVYNEDGVLLLGRGALASRPPQTIPREELNALVLGIQAVDELLYSVTFDYSPKEIIVLSDSLLNIQRLRKSRYFELQPIYEANRVQQIVTTCQSWGIDCTFYHIKGTDNPADKPSRLDPAPPDFMVVRNSVGWLWDPQDARRLDPEDPKGFRITKDSNPPEVSICSVDHLSDSTTKSVMDIKRKVLQAQQETGLGDGVQLVLNQGRVVVPPSIAYELVEFIHAKSGHPGMAKLRYAISKSYTMKDMTGIVHRVCSRCILCQSTKGNRRNSSVQHNGWNQEHLIENSWRTLGLDIYRYNSVDMLTVTDLLSRSIFVQVLAKSKKGYTSSDVAKAFETLCYKTGFGFPSIVYTDNEAIWGSTFERFMKMNGVKCKRVAHYAPFSTFWERLHFEVTKQLQFSNTEPLDQAVLDKVCFILNRRPGPCNGITPLEVLFLRFDGRCPWDMNRSLRPFTEPTPENLGRELKATHNQTMKLLDKYLKLYRGERTKAMKRKGLRLMEPFEIGQQVLVYNSRALKHEFRWKYPPLTIRERIGLKHYLLEDDSVEHEFNLKRFVA
jgi:hypothetical protein